MSRYQPERGFDPIRAAEKFVVSSFVVFSFVAYAVHEHFANSDSSVSSLAVTPTAITQGAPDATETAPEPSQAFGGVSLATPKPAATTASPTAQIARATPRPPATATLRPKGLYRDGSYTGPEVDAFYGTVKVQAVIQNGKISHVQFLEYPNDRRTSVRINSVAVPYLSREAIQAQSANVDIVSGATLTSEAFAQSLQLALSSAKN
ncbi:MAG: FMN-binding protein [Chloroflexi bacterium]|nr:FMN-binding protein [Chloroflexota bacterium]